MNRLVAITLFASLFAFSQEARTVPLFLSFDDAEGDHTGATDLIHVGMSFDNATGEYSIELTATGAAPFIGDFRVNVNLFNLDVGTTAQDPSLFSDTLNDFGLVDPVTSLILTGINPRLLSWSEGDRVLANNLPFGSPSPDGVSFFRSAVSGLPFGPPSRTKTTSPVTERSPW